MAVTKAETKQACLKHLKTWVCCFMRFVSEKFKAKSYKAILQRNSTGVLKHVGDVQCFFLHRHT
jgi:hypothetical protein